ncbi:MAG: helix-turn-helix transcriptional regulator [Gammaproteobacteria bacterium]
MTEFAGRLKLLREARNLTQVRLAELLSIDPRAYNRWERGSSTPQLETLIKILVIDSCVKKSQMAKVMGKAAKG